MTINLKPELEQLIQKDIERGLYQSVDEFVERAVQMLHEEEVLLARASLQKKKADWLKQPKP